MKSGDQEGKRDVYIYIYIKLNGNNKKKMIGKKRTVVTEVSYKNGIR